LAIFLSACGPATALPPTGTPTQASVALEPSAPTPAATPAQASAALEPSAVAPTTLPSPTPVPTALPTPAPTPVEPPVLPAPPAPLALPQGTPEEQAVALADALVSPENRLAAWLGVYDALGIPVIGQDGAPVGATGDDPIGPRFWQVWYASVLDLPGRGIPLSDAGRLMTAGLEGMEGTDLGSVLLDDLRGAALSDDPQVRLLGLFVRERVLRGPTHMDLSDPATTPISATIDLPTVQLLGWVAIRGYVIQAAQQVGKQPAPAFVAAGMTVSVPALRLAGLLAARRVGLASTGQAGGVDRLLGGFWGRTLQQQATQQPCSAAFGSEDVTFWVNWVANKFGGGLQLPGMTKSLPGIIQLIQKQMGTNIDVIEKTPERLGWANAFAAALAFAMQLASVDVGGYEDPDPLERTKGTSDGKQTTIHWALSMDPGKLPDGNNGALCFLSFLTNALGASFSFPAEGRIAGAEMMFEGGAGFPDLVLFGDYKQLRQDTNANGEADLLVLGRGQKKQLPDSVKPVDKEFSVIVSAQPEPANGNSIANIFFGGLSFGTAPGVASAISALVDMLKTFRWDLGEHVFRLTDWKIPGFRYYFNYQGIDVKEGIICSFEKPFTINAKLAYETVNGTYRYDFMPSSPTAGTLTVTGSFTSPSGTIAMTGNGTYEILTPDSETPIVSVMLQKLTTKSRKAYGYMIPGVPDVGTKLDFELEPLQTNECEGQ
jgi:hypothetical protein